MNTFSNRVIAAALETFEDGEAAMLWLNTPQRALDNAIPMVVAVTEEGTKAVETLLGRIKYGVYS